MSLPIEPIIELIYEAGEVALEIYHSDDKAVVLKADNSPVSRGDIAVNEILTKGLLSLYPQIPIISEESHYSHQERLALERFWLIDPIDGTKAFVQKDNGEFTLNIALIENQRPTAGIIYAPYFDELYYGQKGKGAFLIKGQNRHKLPQFTPPQRAIYVSKSHHDEKTQQLIAQIEKQHGQLERIVMSSSLKFCKIARGEGMLYPKMSSTTSEWDIAAADIILFESGKELIDQTTGQPPLYNKPNIRNNPFVARDMIKRR